MSLVSKRAAVFVALLAALLLAVPGQAMASVRQSVSHNLYDSGDNLVGSFNGYIDWNGAGRYYARICIKDQRKDGRAPYFYFRYSYTDGTDHTTRIWYNGNGYGSTVCVEAYVNWDGPAMNGMWMTMGSTGEYRMLGSYWDNPYT